ncbi:MAG: hypothetical protein FIB04_12845 [Gammaproteobacteria bacterium]|nr:hypothetical protein [Gammaproteobacteria bacterium]
MSYEFAGYRFDSERGLDGPSGRISLRRTDARLLQLLLDADGRTVTKDAIVAEAWEGRAVTDDSIFQAVRRLRQAMPAASGTEIVQTVHGAGLRIGTRVLRLAAGGGKSPPAFAPSPRVEATAALTSARELSARRSARDLSNAIEAARSALELDPEYVAAWVALADFHLLQAGRMVAPPKQAGAAAVEAANKALALDPACLQALADRGWVKAVVDLDVRQGLADFDACLRVSDKHWLARGLHAWALIAAGRLDEAVAEMKASHALNPWAGWSSGVLAMYLFFSGEDAAAIAHARESASRFPDVEISHQQLSMVASGLGLHDEAIAAGRRAIELAPDTPLVHSALPCALALAGRREEALPLIRAIEDADFPVASTWLSIAWLALGDRARALDRLREARDTGAPQFVYAFVDPRLRALRGDPGLERLRPTA